MARSAAEIRELVDRLDYDFTQFELHHFLQHIETLRRREMVTIAFAFDPSLYGVWILGESVDYLFYNSSGHPVHQIHIILHEVGHMLLKHACYPLEQVLPPDLLAQLRLDRPQGRLRRVPDATRGKSIEEQECERFVSVIQSKLVERDRIHQLTGQSTSSIAAFQVFTDSITPDSSSG